MIPLLFLVPLAAATQDEGLTLWAERVYTAPGEFVEGASLRIEDGRLVSIAGGKAEPSDEDGGVLRVRAITAGMIDASARVTSGPQSVEQSEEVQPHLRVSGTLDPFDPRWDRLLKSGVTAALITPPDRNVVGGLGVVVKTGGGESIAERIVKQDAVLRGAIGTEPSAGNRAWGRPNDFYHRRPTTRMGVEWAWRKAFYDADAARRDPDRAYPGSDVMQRVLAGEIPLSIQAWTTQDIRTAVFLEEELARDGLGEIELIIDAGAEAWRDPALLERSESAVVLPPFPPEGRTEDGAFMAWGSARKLLDHGIPVALSSHASRSATDRLAAQAARARRGGLTFDEALAAVTTTPARLLGVDDRLGTIAPDKDADLVLWNGTPFEATSRVVGVVLDGRLALDPR